MHAPAPQIQANAVLIAGICFNIEKKEIIRLKKPQLDYYGAKNYEKHRRKAEVSRAIERRSNFSLTLHNQTNRSGRGSEKTIYILNVQK